MDLLSLLVGLIIVCLVIWATRALLAAFAVPDPLATVIFVIVVIGLLLAVLQQFAGGGTFLRLR